MTVRKTSVAAITVFPCDTGLRVQASTWHAYLVQAEGPTLLWPVLVIVQFRLYSLAHDMK